MAQCVWQVGKWQNFSPSPVCTETLQVQAVPYTHLLQACHRQKGTSEWNKVVLLLGKMGNKQEFPLPQHGITSRGHSPSLALNTTEEG